MGTSNHQPRCGIVFRVASVRVRVCVRERVCVPVSACVWLAFGNRKPSLTSPVPLPANETRRVPALCGVSTPEGRGSFAARLLYQHYTHTDLNRAWSALEYYHPPQKRSFLYDSPRTRVEASERMPRLGRERASHRRGKEKREREKREREREEKRRMLGRCASVGMP